MNGADKVPELCNFAGIFVYLRFNDVGQHYKPHVHIKYGDYKAVVSLDGELLAGSIPKKQFKILVGWLALREEEVYRAWNQAVKSEHFDKILPLK
ncbi:DUF4160 domain-containing protein [Eubacteriaceae bacterium ES3]|nr:DUF4160 domain-containing protein [Eubacteriaceae bacterium ES3]